jgi:hypothetical protein
MNIRLLPPTSVAEQVRVISGRTYSAAPGTVIDVIDSDAAQLEANGWIAVAPSGPTASRPSSAPGLYQAVPVNNIMIHRSQRSLFTMAGLGVIP